MSTVTAPPSLPPNPHPPAAAADVVPATDAGPTGGAPAGRSRPRVAYVVSRFPRLTETFVVSEVKAAVEAGADVHLYPLHRERAAVVQPDVAAISHRVHHERLLGAEVVRSQVRTIGEQPVGYLRALGALVRHNLGCRRLLVGAIASFPLAVHLARRFREEGVDHVHAHFATHPAAVAYVVHRLTGIPFSFTAHGSDLHRDRHMLAEKVRRARFVATVSDYNRRVILDECGSGVADRVTVVRCGVDPTAFPPREPKRREPGAPLRVVCTGTLHEVKGQAHLIEACRRALASGTDLTLTLLGDGPDRAALEAAVRDAGIGHHVRFAGAVTREQVLDALRGADVAVVPSVPSADGRLEGLPVVILEAMAVGVPVVASRLTGIPEVVDHGRTGLLVDPGDVEGLCRAINRLAQSPRFARQLAVAARAHVARHHDPAASARELVDRFAGAGR